MSSDDNAEKDCPLCMEPLDTDDQNFYPCTCQYQICRFCWHRIRTDENCLCPACRQTYPENPVNFQPANGGESQKLKVKTKPRPFPKPKCVADSRKHLADYRVLQKNLVYVVGLSQKLADVECLKKQDFFGRFGRIVKVVVGSPTANGSGQAASYTAYVTYAREDDALKAIEAVNNLVLDGRLLKASLGTTKYCSTFMRGQSCQKMECMYLHAVSDEALSFTKEDMHAGKHNELEKKFFPRPRIWALFQLHEQLAERTRKARKAAQSAAAVERTDVDAERAEVDAEQAGAKAETTEAKTARTEANNDWVEAERADAERTAAEEVKRAAGEEAARAAAEAMPAAPVVLPPPMPRPTTYDDDDLGFDPISVSAQALADLVMEEQVTMSNASTQPGMGVQRRIDEAPVAQPTPQAADYLSSAANSRTISILHTLFSQPSRSNNTPQPSLAEMRVSSQPVAAPPATPPGGNRYATMLAMMQPNARVEASVTLSDIQPRLFQRQATAAAPAQAPSVYASTSALQQQQHAACNPASAPPPGHAYHPYLHECVYGEYRKLREYAAACRLCIPASSPPPAW